MRFTRVVTSVKSKVQSLVPNTNPVVPDIVKVWLPLVVAFALILSELEVSPSRMVVLLSGILVAAIVMLRKESLINAGLMLVIVELLGWGLNVKLTPAPLLTAVWLIRSEVAVKMAEITAPLATPVPLIDIPALSPEVVTAVMSVLALTRVPVKEMLSLVSVPVNWRTSVADILTLLFTSTDITVDPAWTPGPVIPMPGQIPSVALTDISVLACVP